MILSELLTRPDQRQPVDVSGVTAAIELALVANELTNMQKLEFVKRKVEFMQEFGDVKRYRDAGEQLKQFRKLCAVDLKVQAKKKKEFTLGSVHSALQPQEAWWFGRGGMGESKEWGTFMQSFGQKEFVKEFQKQRVQILQQFVRSLKRTNTRHLLNNFDL